MAELKLTTYDEITGKEKLTPWTFTPIDSELQLIRQTDTEDESTSTTDLSEPVFGKVSYVLTIGAGTLRREDARKMLLRLIFCKRVLWKHRIANADVWREYTPKFDRSVVFDYLNGKRSLPRLVLTLTETRGRHYYAFEKFIEEVGVSWART